MQLLSCGLHFGQAPCELPALGGELLGAAPELGGLALAALGGAVLLGLHLSLRNQQGIQIPLHLQAFDPVLCSGSLGGLAGSHGLCGVLLQMLRLLLKGLDLGAEVQLLQPGAGPELRSLGLRTLQPSRLRLNPLFDACDVLPQRIVRRHQGIVLDLHLLLLSLVEMNLLAFFRECAVHIVAACLGGCKLPIQLFDIAVPRILRCVGLLALPAPRAEFVQGAPECRLGRREPALSSAADQLCGLQPLVEIVTLAHQRRQRSR
mmetsp:Transcript_47054/g.134699  ORF Transcript_47054/g.134699 Transcript_47054/m.134699 type:complete len:262 (-) Transcript_47054:338-1123(-)